MKTISVKVSTSELLITAKSRGKKNDISLNLYAANERKGLLADISKRKVKLSEA